MIDREEQIRFIAKLIKLTQAGVAVWSEPSVARGPVGAETDFSTNVFGTNIEGQSLQLRARHLPSPPAPFLGADQENPQIQLTFLDAAGQAIWTISGLSVLRDLLQAVTSRPANVRNAIDRIMKVNV